MIDFPAEFSDPLIEGCTVEDTPLAPEDIKTFAHNPKTLHGMRRKVYSVPESDAAKGLFA